MRLRRRKPSPSFNVTPPPRPTGEAHPDVPAWIDFAYDAQRDGVLTLTTDEADALAAIFADKPSGWWTEPRILCGFPVVVLPPRKPKESA